MDTLAGCTQLARVLLTAIPPGPGPAVAAGGGTGWLYSLKMVPSSVSRRSIFMNKGMPSPDGLPKESARSAASSASSSAAVSEPGSVTAPGSLPAGWCVWWP